MFDSLTLPKINHQYIEAELSRMQKNLGYSDKNIAIFVICTISKRWREGTWKKEAWENHSILLSREKVLDMDKDEVSKLIIEMIIKELHWEKAAAV